MALYRYRPKGNRTPVNDPVFGHLAFDGEYDNPACAEDPRFVEINDEKPASGAKPKAGSKDDKTAADKAPEAGEPAGASK